MLFVVQQCSDGIYAAINTKGGTIEHHIVICSVIPLLRCVEGIVGRTLFIKPTAGPVCILFGNAVLGNDTITLEVAACPDEYVYCKLFNKNLLYPSFCRASGKIPWKSATVPFYPTYPFQKEPVLSPLPLPKRKCLSIQLFCAVLLLFLRIRGIIMLL